MGLINEGGTKHNEHVGAIQGGTGKYASALGTFQQVVAFGNIPGVGTPGAVTNPSPGTPAADQTVVLAKLDLLLPAGS
jgi:hypothetical protein